ncbi:hypothetical protein DERF_002655 [Dermatophagoides farinae]|uniref:Uncharacterized protein n=1 Tax=Dermatophagoides farinae TaxID=6954 RepID=A0A922IGL3_DERFA|nr:hypothetical protein DERF_002655 [Dermatophagoides farinae]
MTSFVNYLNGYSGCSRRLLRISNQTRRPFSPWSSESRILQSSSLISKSNTVKLIFSRSGFTVFGMAMMPRCMSHRIAICAVVRSYLAAIDSTVLSFNTLCSPGRFLDNGQ